MLFEHASYFITKYKVREILFKIIKVIDFKVMVDFLWNRINYYYATELEECYIVGWGGGKQVIEEIDYFRFDKYVFVKR